MNDLAIPALRIPARRRIGSAHTTFIYDGEISMLGEITTAISALTSTVQLLRSAAATKRDFDIAAATSDSSSVAGKRSAIRRETLAP